VRTLLPLVLAALATAAPAATVTMLDGTVVEGERVQFDANRRLVVIAGTSLPLADCDRFLIGDDVLPSLPGGVLLADGGWLPARSVRAGEAADTIRVDSALGPLVLPLVAVAGWGDLPAGKRDVVAMESGTYEGRVQGITGGKLVVATDLDPKPLELPVEAVKALRLAVPLRPVKGLVLTATLDDQRAPLTLLAGSPLRLAVAPDVALSAAPPVVMRVEGGRRVYLSSLDPASVDEQGAFGVTWPHTRDRNLDGAPLRLGGIRHAHGLAVHSQATLTWNLGGGYERLRALAGIADEIGAEGDCSVRIAVDGKTQWSRDSVRGREKPILIDLPLTGAKVLTLTVEFGKRFDIGDRFTLADAYLVRTAK